MPVSTDRAEMCYVAMICGVRRIGSKLLRILSAGKVRSITPGSSFARLFHSSHMGLASMLQTPQVTNPSIIAA
jgi:hypothetical protein